MDDKSHVTMEQQVCIVCGQTFDTGAILIDQRLRKQFDHHTVTGWGLCPEHQKLYDDGYIALVEVDPNKSRTQAGTNMKPEDAYRTGTVAHLRKSRWESVFNAPVPNTPVVFVEPGVIKHLQEL